MSFLYWTKFHPLQKLETELNNYPNLENQLAEKDKEISQLKEEMQRLEAQMMEDIRRETREPRPSAKRYRSVDVHIHPFKFFCQL